MILCTQLHGHLVFLFYLFTFIGAMAFPLPRPEASQLPQCLVRNTDCQQKAVRAVRFNGEMDHTHSYFIVFHFISVNLIYFSCQVWQCLFVIKVFIFKTQPGCTNCSVFVWGKRGCCCFFKVLFRFWFFNAVHKKKKKKNRIKFNCCLVFHCKEGRSTRSTQKQLVLFQIWRKDVYTHFLCGVCMLFAYIVQCKAPWPCNFPL